MRVSVIFRPKISGPCSRFLGKRTDWKVGILRKACTAVCTTLRKVFLSLEWGKKQTKWLLFFLSSLPIRVANHRRNGWMAPAPWAWRNLGAGACRTLPSVEDSTGACPPRIVKQAPSHMASMGQHSLVACPCHTQTSLLMWTWHPSRHQQWTWTPHQTL